MMKTEPVFECEVNMNLEQISDRDRQPPSSLLSFIGSSRYRAGISEVSCMRESGFTEVRWYHGQIVRPKLITILAWGFFNASKISVFKKIDNCETHNNLN